MCFNKVDGKLLWQKEMKGDAVSRISGCFGDNSGPAAVSDGKSVCFFNASGLINKYDLDGNLIWSINIQNSRRTDPFVLDGVLVIIGSAEVEKIEGRHIKGIDFKTGKVLWQSESHSWDGLTLVPYKKLNGEWVGLIARGGGHVKAEYTDGYELISLKTGKSFWKTEFKNFRSTQNFTLKGDKAYIFLPNGIHQVINLENGEILREDKLLEGAMVADHDGSKYVYKSFDGKIDLKRRTITQMSNLIVGEYHFFRTYNDNYLGRVHLKTGKAEYLELPTQIERSSGSVRYCWGPTEEGKKFIPKNKKNKPQLANLWLIKANDMISNSGHKVVGDARSHYSGWGHVSAALPTAVGDKLYVPTMSGVIYVIKWDAKKLDGESLISISDLGLLGDSWTRSSVTYSEGLLFGRTIKELICISGCTPQELK
ncbi:MAG: PQQ-binding-like beta-propeller repeat protein [Lentisphaerales bacterium]|nr:PQQ-binding-like beta-propeller repeat protein [Lentisphaerales bacterium]